jgi:hypothetical protein
MRHAELTDYALALRLGERSTSVGAKAMHAEIRLMMNSRGQRPVVLPPLAARVARDAHSDHS